MEKITAFFMSVIAFILGIFGINIPNQGYETFSFNYGTSEYNDITVYVPDSAYERDYNGCILYIHGGSWTAGDKSEMNKKCESYVKKGYITATMNYSLAKDGSNINAFTMISDINTAIEEIKSFSQEKNLNITKLATSGNSAGGHLSLLYSYASTNPHRGSELDIVKPAIPLVFTANTVAPADLHPNTWKNSIVNFKSALGLVETLSGKEIFEVKDGEVIYSVDEATVESIINLISPVGNVTSDLLPSLFAYGGMDFLVPLGHCNSITSRCMELGVKYDLVIFPKSGHNLALDHKCEKEYNRLLEEYCLTYFGY